MSSYIKKVSIILLVLFIPIIARALSPNEVEEIKKKALEDIKKYEKDIKKENIHKSEGERRARESYETYKKEVEPKVKDMRDRMRYENGKLTFDGEKRPEMTRKGRFLAEDERIYIFISSSIPKNTVKNYAILMDKIRDPNIAMVMRGCIGGCKKFMPTVKWIQDIVAPSEQEQYVAEVLIDPFLFRAYDIKSVPAVVYIKGLALGNEQASEGFTDNLKQTPIGYVLYGDTALEYALNKINEKAKSPSLTKIDEELRKTWFQNKQQ